MQEEQIQAYVFGELSPGEAEAVARAIREDESLQALEQHYRQIYAGLRAERISNLASEVLAFDQTLNHSKQTGRNDKQSGRGRWLFLGFMALMVIISGLFYGRSQYTDVALATTHFILPQDPRVAGSTQENQLYQEALELFFNDKNYPVATENLEQLAENAPDYRTSAVYLNAHALFLAGTYSVAEENFSQLINNQADYPRPQQSIIRWNAMMTRLAVGQTISPSEEEWPESFPVEKLEDDLDSWFR